MNLKHILTLVAVLGLFSFTQAQEASLKQDKSFFSKNMDYQIRAHVSIGGSSPLGLPREIRKIKSYDPTLVTGIEFNATKWFSDQSKWGIKVGFKLEDKAMKTDARVKDYLIEITQAQSISRGYFTGDVKTDVRNTYLTLPVSVVYKVADRWNIYAGMFASIAVDRQFKGHVYNGYLREGTPTGFRVDFEGEAVGEYDYSREVNKFAWGSQIGFDYSIDRNFKVFSDLTYGINGVLKKDFNAISFTMHNIYLNIGMAYQF